MDKIIIKNARFLCNVGITEEERRDKQEIFIDIELYFEINDVKDSIEKTINYSEVNKKVKQLIENKEYNLIETIANEIADFILNSFDLNKVHITIKKPKAIGNADYAAVEITREK